MASTEFGSKRTPIPKLLFHPGPTCVVDTNPSSGNAERSVLATVTSNKLSSPESPRSLRRAKKTLSLSRLVKPAADSLVPPHPMIPLSPPPVSVTNKPDVSDIHPITPNSLTSRRKPSGVAKPVPKILCSPPTPPSPTCPSSGIQLSPPSSPVLPRIGTHQRPYYSTVRANKNSRSASDVSPPSSPSASPYSITFPTLSSAQQSKSSVSGRSETSSNVGRLSPTCACSPAASYSNDHRHHTSQSPVVTVPPLPPLRPPSPASFSFQTRVGAPSSGRGSLPALDLTQDEDEDENASFPGPLGMKVWLVKYLGTKKAGTLKEKVKNPLSLSPSSRRRHNRSSGLRSDQRHEFIPPSPTLSTSQSLIGLRSTQGGSMSGEMELRMTLAERDINSGSGIGNSSAPSFSFRENHNGRERGRGRSGGRKLIKARSSIELTSNLSPGSFPTPEPSKPRIAMRLREIMGASFLGKGRNAARS
jgi:hypothetical protein